MDRWEKKLEKEGLGNLKDEELEQLARAKIMEQKVELEKVKKARLERERERQERLELEDLAMWRIHVLYMNRDPIFFVMYRIAARIFTKSESLLKLKFKAFFNYPRLRHNFTE